MIHYCIHPSKPKIYNIYAIISYINVKGQDREGEYPVTPCTGYGGRDVCIVRFHSLFGYHQSVGFIKLYGL